VNNLKEWYKFWRKKNMTKSKDDDRRNIRCDINANSVPYFLSLRH
jgi:hypothetical protein